MDAELQLQDDFQAASKYVAGLSTSLDQETLLYFYARFKLVNFGPCNIDKPGFFDFQGKAKWTAWKSLYNMSKELAMEEYVEKLNIIDPEWTLKEPQEAKDKCWVSVSRSMVQAENFIEDEDKTLINWIQDGNVEKVDQILWKTPYLGKQALEDGMWAIHWASDRGLAEMVTCLINYGADVNAQDEDLQTPLHYACSVGHTEVIKILLSQDDIDITLKDSDGKTAMDTIEDNHIKELFNKSEI